MGSEGERHRQPRKVTNEMVSFGDTAISLHILQPPLTGGVGGGWGGVGRGGGLWKVKTQSAKICLNLGRGGSCSGKSSKPKVPRSA